MSGAQGPEGRIVRAIIEMIRGLPGGHARKVHPNQFAGTGEPDIDGCVRGRAVKIEVKVPGKHPTVLQDKVLRQWRDAGAIAGCAHSVAEAEQLLREGGVMGA